MRQPAKNVLDRRIVDSVLKMLDRKYTIGPSEFNAQRWNLTVVRESRRYCHGHTGAGDPVTIGGSKALPGGEIQFGVVPTIIAFVSVCPTVVCRVGSRDFEPVGNGEFSSFVKR